jgi:hypothetical protein
MDGEPISSREFKQRLARLCLTSKLTGLPRNRRDRRIVLKSLTLGWTPGRRLAEHEINIALTRWLREVGRSMETDHVTLRRALVDEGFLERAAGGEWYQLGPRSAREDWFAPDVDAIDPETVLRDAVDELEMRRIRYQAPGAQPKSPAGDSGSDPARNR